MSKIRFLQNKETIITLGLMIGAVILIMINIVALIPAVISVYTETKQTATKEPIDAATVNKAIEYLNQNK